MDRSTIQGHVIPSSVGPSVHPIAPSDSASVDGRFRIGTELKLGAVGVLVGLLTIPAFESLWTVWSTRDDASHGFIIPLITLYLIRRIWPELRQLPVRPAPGLGFLPVLGSLAGLLIGNTGSIVTLSGVSFITLSAGLALMLFGASWLRMLLFPLAYLLFMVPVFDSLLEPLQPYFQLLTATMAQTLLTQFGVPSYQTGTLLYLPTGTVEIAAQCSGVGFLISILAVGLPLVYLALRTVRMRSLLLFATLLISVFANWLRVALIALSGHLWGWDADLHGPLHILHAMSVYWIGLGTLVIGIGVAVKREGPAAKRPTAVSTTPPAQSAIFPHSSNGIWYATCTILACALMVQVFSDQSPTSVRRELTGLPTNLGEWTWDTAAREERPIVTVDSADHELVRTYRNAVGEQVQLYIGYLASQTQGKELVNHRTNVLHRQATPVTLPVNGSLLTINRASWEEAGRSEPLLFWYGAQGRVYAGRLQAKLMTSIQALSGQGSQGALILLKAPHSAHHISSDTPHERLQEFARSLLPLLNEFLP